MYAIPPFRFFLIVLIALGCLSATAWADSKTLRDDRDSDGPLDLVQVFAEHDGRLLVHKWQTDERWSKEDLKYGDLTAYFNTDADGRIERYLSVYYSSSEDRLVGRMKNRRGDIIGYATISRPNRKSARAVFRRSLLRQSLKKYWWYAESIFYDTEAPCDIGCRDRAPNRGRVLHRVR